MPKAIPAYEYKFVEINKMYPRSAEEKMNTMGREGWQIKNFVDGLALMERKLPAANG